MVNLTPASFPYICFGFRRKNSSLSIDSSSLERVLWLWAGSHAL